jgi:hypothetical protein
MKTTSLWTKRIGLLLVLAILFAVAAAARGNTRVAFDGGVQADSTWAT